MGCHFRGRSARLYADRLGAALAIAIALLLSGQGSPAGAQTCTILGGGRDNIGGNVGQVWTWGDLKIRIVSVWWSADGAGRYVQIDIKAPGFAANGVQLKADGDLQMFSICGQDVSIGFQGFNDGVLTVGVF